MRAEHKDEFRALMLHARSLGMGRVAFVRSDSETGQLHLANVQRLARETGIEAVTAVFTPVPPSASATIW